jgi:hypothetical protein
MGVTSIFQTFESSNTNWRSMRREEKRREEKRREEASSSNQP